MRPTSADDRNGRRFLGHGAAHRQGAAPPGHAIQRLEGDAVHIDLKLSQRELGGIVGLARENVNRQLRAWQHEGLIRTDQGHIIIDDMEGLQAIAEEL
ncbi:MAG: Crp/Fnr family transcriptional regulator [Geminicoccaceae bacterium]